MDDTNRAISLEREVATNIFGVATRSIEELAVDAIALDTNFYQRMVILHAMDQRFGRDARLDKIRQMIEVNNLLTGESRPS